MYLILLSGKCQDIPLILVEDLEEYLKNILDRVIFPVSQNKLLRTEAYEPQNPEERDNLVLDNLSQLLDLNKRFFGEREDWNFLYAIEIYCDHIPNIDPDSWRILYTFNQYPIIIKNKHAEENKQQNYLVYSDGVLITCCRTFKKAKSFIEEYLTTLGYKGFTWDIRGNVAKLKDFDYTIESIPFLEDSL